MMNPTSDLNLFASLFPISSPFCMPFRIMMGLASIRDVALSIAILIVTIIVISYIAIYLQICCCLSLGSIGYTVYERFLQSTGKTMLSTISQISGTRLTLLQVINNKVIMLVKRSLINNDKSHIGYEW